MATYIYVYIYIHTHTTYRQTDYPILGAGIARARKGFQHPLLTSKPATMTSLPINPKVEGIEPQQDEMTSLICKFTSKCHRLPHPWNGVICILDTHPLLIKYNLLCQYFKEDIARLVIQNLGICILKNKTHSKSQRQWGVGEGQRGHRLADLPKRNNGHFITNTC